jgi:Glycosyl hydrolases family 25/Putative peptidoglycan binding domain
MTVFIADIASYQQGLVPAALVPSCAALEIKVTEGSSYVDPDYAAWLPAAKAAGLLVIAYHYLDTSPAAAQAAWLKSHIVDTTLPIMLDVENGTLANALDVSDAMTALGLRPKLFYFAHSYWQTQGEPDLAAPLGSRGLSLINASYPSNASGSPVALYPGDSGSGWDPYGGVTPALWQYTDAGDEDGQHVDVNAYRGTAAALAVLLGEPTPTGAPAAAGSALTGWPELRQGSSGTWVSIAQQAVKLAGQNPAAVDGRFGPQTQAAVEGAQQALGDTRDGVVGPQTWGSLQQRTLVVQNALTAIGLGAGGTDSIAGPDTAAEVIAAQARFAIAQDGIVGPETSGKLGIAAP